MLNLSLSGCGFLGIYHIGVISAFREHAPHFLQGTISGCSAGSLVAVCAVCDCCLGQMVSDVLECALKARSYALGPLHPSFNIVDIVRNGLRRILPVDAHKICSGRVNISITRWKDGKNFLVNQFDSREELIQALICSTFVPCYSGFFPPKFKGTYYWDGGLSNNNPILNEDTILVSPFGGEADICPREESSSFYCYDFQGTNFQFSHENIYRLSKALFPPNPEVLKAMCFRGYKDAVSFLKARNLLQCSCNRMRDKTSISSVIGEDLNAYSIYGGGIGNEMLEEEVQSDSMYDSEEDNISQYAQSNEPLNYKEMPTLVCDILDAACNDNKGFLNYVYDSELSRIISIMFLPWTLPFEFSFNFTKRVLELVPKFKVSANKSKNLIDFLFMQLNYIIQKFTYDKFQFHQRVIKNNVCQHCLPKSRTFAHQNACNHGSKANLSKLGEEGGSSAQLLEHNFHPAIGAGGGTTAGDINLPAIHITSPSYHSSRFSSSSNNFYYPKICPRHRVPSVCGSSDKAGSVDYAQQQYPAAAQTMLQAAAAGRRNKSRRTRSFVSNASEQASSVDINEFKLSNKPCFSKKKSSKLAKNGASAALSCSMPVRSSGGALLAAANGKTHLSTNVFGRKSPPTRAKASMPDTVDSGAAAAAGATRSAYATSNAININPSALVGAGRSKKESSTAAARVHFSLAHSSTTNTEEEDNSIDKMSTSNETYNVDRLFKPIVSESGGEAIANGYRGGEPFSAQKCAESHTTSDVEMPDADQVMPFMHVAHEAPSKTAPPQLPHAAKVFCASESADLLFNLEKEKAPDVVVANGHHAVDEPERMNLNSEGNKASIEWDNYWDNLEFNALGKFNI